MVTTGPMGAESYMRRRFFAGGFISAATVLMFVLPTILAIGSFMAWGISWSTGVATLVAATLLLVYLSACHLAYTVRSELSQLQKRMVAMVRTSQIGPAPATSSNHLDSPSNLQALETNLEALEVRLRDLVAAKVAGFDAEESRRARLNDEMERLHREISYLRSSLSPLTDVRQRAGERD